VCKKLIKNSQPFGKYFQKTLEGGGFFLTHTVDATARIYLDQSIMRLISRLAVYVCLHSTALELDANGLHVSLRLYYYDRMFLWTDLLLPLNWYGTLLQLFIDWFCFVAFRRHLHISRGTRHLPQYRLEFSVVISVFSVVWKCCCNLCCL